MHTRSEEARSGHGCRGNGHPGERSSMPQEIIEQGESIKARSTVVRVVACDDPFKPIKP